MPSKLSDLDQQLVGIIGSSSSGLIVRSAKDVLEEYRLGESFTVQAVARSFERLCSGGVACRDSDHVSGVLYVLTDKGRDEHRLIVDPS